MKILSRSFSKGADGYVKMILEQPEDMWHAYNLIAEGDRILSSTVRKVQKETAGGQESERVRLKLEVEVEAIEFDATASVLRVRGKTIGESEHVRPGSYHTLELDLQRQFTLTKDVWDALYLDRLREASDPAATADVAAVMMQEGLANICLIGGSITTVKARIETSIPRKRGAAIAGYDKALTRFFENVLQGILRHVDFTIVRCLIIASPGFTKDQFLEYLHLEAVRRDLRALIENKSRIMGAHASSGYKHSLKEVFADPVVANLIKDTKAAREVRAMEEFHTMLANDSARAFYGPKHVEAANESLAIQTLLISDNLFRNADVVTRRRYVDLVESVKASGGEALIFSSMHISGDQLNQLTGVAALLRFPLPDIEDMDP